MKTPIISEQKRPDGIQLRWEMIFKEVTSQRPELLYDGVDKMLCHVIPQRNPLKHERDPMGTTGLTGILSNLTEAWSLKKPFLIGWPIIIEARTASLQISNLYALKQRQNRYYVLRYRKRAVPVPTSTVSCVKFVKRQMAVRAGKTRCDLSASVCLDAIHSATQDLYFQTSYMQTFVYIDSSRNDPLNICKRYQLLSKGIHPLYKRVKDYTHLKTLMEDIFTCALCANEVGEIRTCGILKQKLKTNG